MIPLTIREIAEAVRAGTMALELAGHQTNDTKKSFLAEYDDNVANANGKNDGKWSDSSAEVDAGMREFFQHKLDFVVDQDAPLTIMFDRSSCFGCGKRLQWVLTGDKLQLRNYWQANPNERRGRGGEMVNYPVDYVCPFATPQPTKGEIKVTSRLLFANFFLEVEDSQEDEKHSEDWSLNNLAGRKRITEYKAERNVAYGQMGNMSIGIYINEAKDSIIVGPKYHPAEDEDYDTDEEYEKAMALPVFPGYELIGGICLDVWRWEATDLNTIGAENYDKVAERHGNRGMVEIDVPHGVWSFEHYYDTKSNANKYIYAKLDLKSSNA